MLAAHGRAVRTHDRAAFLAGVSTAPGAQQFRQAQRAEFANLTRLPFARWSYQLGPRAQAPGEQAAARRQYGPSAVIYRVSVSFALRGIDARPTSHPVYWTFATDGGGVVAASAAGMARIGGPSWRGPWDFGRLTIVRAPHCLVLGHESTGLGLLHLLARTVSAAVPAVSSVWGSDWSRDVLVLVPAGGDELGVDLGPETADPAPVAAAAASDGTDPVSGTVLGQRLVVDPARLRGVSAVGLQILLRHEVTHIADAAATSEATPSWLAEGFAEYVGNLDSGQSVRAAAAELAAQIRHGRVPRALPGLTQFSGAGAAQAYEESWLACRLLAARLGAAGLVRFYRSVGGSEQLPGAAAAAAVHRSLHEPMSGFVQQWRGYLRAELGSGAAPGR
jgi:hypothetical protein